MQCKARELTDDLQNERSRFGVEVHGGVVDSADVLLNVASVKYVFNIASGQKAVEYIDKAYALVDAHAGDPAVECLVHVFCAAGNFLQRMECTVRHLPRERVVLHNAHLVAFHNGVCTVIFKQHADELVKVGVDVPQVYKLADLLRKNGLAVKENIKDDMSLVKAIKQAKGWK